MSGGHFDYKQYQINDIIESVEKVISVNGTNELDDYGDMLSYELSPETLEKFKEGLHHLKMASIYAQRMDWLLSGDDGEETFHLRLKEDIESEFGS